MNIDKYFENSFWKSIEIALLGWALHSANPRLVHWNQAVGAVVTQMFL